MKKGVNTALRLSIHRAHCQMAIGRYRQPSDYHGTDSQEHGCTRIRPTAGVVASDSGNEPTFPMLLTLI